MNNRQLLRAYSIKEVSQIINIPTGTIRQWEKDLNGLLVIPRTQQGARYYTDNEIKILNKIKEMRAQRVSKGMIRSLLEKYLNEDSTPSSESAEMAVQPVQETPNQPSTDIQTNTNNMEEFYAAMATFKQDLLDEIKSEMTVNKNDLIAEVKNELSDSSLGTVKEISKSIQRSNDKRRVEVHKITNTIMKASEVTSETFATLSNDILNDSEATYEKLSNDILKGSEVTYEKLSKRINQSNKLAGRDNKVALEKVSQTIMEAKNEIQSVSEAFDSQQDFLTESLNELKQSQEEIKKREEIFQSMISSYREVAAAKNTKKKWWKGWF